MQDYDKIITPEPKNVHPRLGQAYVPYQKYENINEPENALKHGTVFMALDLPWEK